MPIKPGSPPKVMSRFRVLNLSVALIPAVFFALISFIYLLSTNSSSTSFLGNYGGGFNYPGCCNFFWTDFEWNGQCLEHCNSYQECVDNGQQNGCSCSDSFCRAKFGNCWSCVSEHSTGQRVCSPTVCPEGQALCLLPVYAVILLVLGLWWQSSAINTPLLEVLSARR